MSNPIPIKVESLGKKFILQQRGSRTLKSTVLDWVRGAGKGREDFWALRDVSFTVERGETLGIVGANGAGKSTLLSLLAGTKEPTEGTIEMHGKISSLLELGAGFHPELTGRENVFLAGAIMGMSRAHMAERFDSIVDFAELHKFIDQPVKHYSSGMYVRLGFAVAVEVDPDILLLDEVLAVGDTSFQRKCLERVEDFRKSGKTMLIISHDLDTIKDISNRILFLDSGTVQGLGEPDAVVDQYHSLSRVQDSEGLRREWGTGEVRISTVELLDTDGQPSDLFQWGEPMTARMHYVARVRVENPVFGFSISDSQGRLVYGNNTQLEGVVIPTVKGEGMLEFRIGELNLSRGNYLLSVSVHSSDHRTNYHRLDHCFPFAVEAEKSFEGCYMPITWKV